MSWYKSIYHFLFKFMPMFYTLVFYALGNVLVKSRSRFGVLKYNTFRPLSHITKLLQKRINAYIPLDSNAYILTTGSFSVVFFFFFFHFSESRIFSFHKLHYKQTKIIFHITKFTLSDRIYPIEYTYIRIEGILCPDQFYVRSKFGQYDKEKNRAPYSSADFGITAPV